MFNKKNGNVTDKEILAALSTVQEPELHDELGRLNALDLIHINGGQVGFLEITTKALENEQK